MRALEVPLSDSEYDDLTAGYGQTATGTRWEALRTALKLKGLPAGWGSGYEGISLTVRTLREVSPTVHQPPTEGEYASEWSDRVLAEITAALADSNASLRLVRTFTHGLGVQVMVKTRKIGPILFPPDDGTIADTLKMLGDMALSHQDAT